MKAEARSDSALQSERAARSEAMKSSFVIAEHTVPYDHPMPTTAALSSLKVGTWLALAVLFAMVIAGFAASVQAQTAKPDAKKFGAWSIVCDVPPGASSEQCALMQNVVAEDRPEVGLSVVVLKTADNKARILRVLAPLGVILPNGLGLNIDGKDLGRASFVRCMPDGCYSEVILKDDLLGTLRTGQSATFIIFASPEEGIGIPVDLAGFKDGFANLP